MAKEKRLYKGWRILTGDGEKSEKDRIKTKKEAAEKNAAGRPTNDYFATHDEEFKAACERAGIPATARQASKWHRKRGLAYANRQV